MDTPIIQPSAACFLPLYQAPSETEEFPDGTFDTLCSAHASTLAAIALFDNACSDVPTRGVLHLIERTLDSVVKGAYAMDVEGALRSLTR